MSYSNFCAGYSVVGFIFMIFVGVLLSTQPFFIGGIHDVKLAKESAFGAAGLFIISFVASICCLYFDQRRRPKPPFEIVHAIDDDDVYGGLSYPVEYDGESEYVQRALVSSRSTVQEYRQRQRQRQQQSGISVNAMSLVEMRSRPAAGSFTIGEFS